MISSFRLKKQREKIRRCPTSSIFAVIIMVASYLFMGTTAYAQVDPIPSPSSKTPRVKLQPQPVPAIVQEMTRWLNNELLHRGVDVDHDAIHLVLLVDTSAPDQAETQAAEDFVTFLLDKYLVRSSTAADHVSLGFFQTELYENAFWEWDLKNDMDGAWLRKWPNTPMKQREGYGGQDFEQALLSAWGNSRLPRQTVFLLFSRRNRSTLPNTAPNSHLAKDDPAKMSLLRQYFPKSKNAKDDIPKDFTVSRINPQTGRSSSGTLYVSLFVPKDYTSLGKLTDIPENGKESASPRRVIQKEEHPEVAWGTILPVASPPATSIPDIHNSPPATVKPSPSVPKTPVNTVGHVPENPGNPVIPWLLSLGGVVALGGIYYYWLMQPISVTVGPFSEKIRFGDTLYILRDNDTVSLNKTPAAGVIARLTVTGGRAVKMNGEGRFRIRNAPITLTTTDKTYRAQSSATTSDTESEEIEFRAQANS